MKKLLLILCLIAAPALGADVVKFDPNTGFCLEYYDSVDEFKYMDQPDYMIFTDKTKMTLEELRTLLKTVPITNLKKTGDEMVAEMDQAEKDQVAAEVVMATQESIGSRYKNLIEQDLVISSIIEEVAALEGISADDLKAKIEQIIADKLGLPNL